MATKMSALLIALFILTVSILASGSNVLATPAAPATPVAAATEATAEVTQEATEAATEEMTPDATDATLALVGDPVRGEDIFRHGLYDAPPCVSCHNPTASGRTGFSIGPGLKGVGERAATRIEGMTAPEYLEDSIRHPAHFLVPGYQPIMYSQFGEKYSDQDIADLIAFLLTL